MKGHIQLKEFQSLENDVCHIVVFGNVVQDVALDANGRWIKCVLNAKKHYFSHDLWNLGTLEDFWKNYFVQICFFFHRFFLTKMFFLTFFSKNFLLLSRPLHCIKVICIETAYFT